MASQPQPQPVPQQQLQPQEQPLQEAEEAMEIDTEESTSQTVPPQPPPTSNLQQTQPQPAADSSSSATATTPRQPSKDPEAQQQQQEQQLPPEEPDSPPLPAKHTAVTPGPRATRLQDLFASTLKHTLDKINRDNFAACFPTVAQRAPGTLEFVQRQMVGRLGQQCDKEFDSILQNRNVVAKLNELESLVSDAARRKADSGGTAAEPPIPPHTLPAETILAAHLAPHLASQQSQLNAKLQTVQSHNARLFDEIQAQRAEMERLLSAVEEVLADVGGANELLDGVVDDLAKETRAVEVEMSGV